VSPATTLLETPAPASAPAQGVKRYALLRHGKSTPRLRPAPAARRPASRRDDALVSLSACPVLCGARRRGGAGARSAPDRRCSPAPRGGLPASSRAASPPCLAAAA